MADLKPLFKDLIRLEIELWDAVDDRLVREVDLQLRNFLTLHVVATTRSCRVHDLVEQLGVAVGTASKAVDRVESTGHCVRRANPADRRSPIIELTSTGRRLYTAAAASVDRELVRRLESVLPAGSLTELSASVAVLRAAGAAGKEP